MPIGRLKSGRWDHLSGKPSCFNADLSLQASQCLSVNIKINATSPCFTKSTLKASEDCWWGWPLCLLNHIHVKERESVLFRLMVFLFELSWTFMNKGTRWPRLGRKALPITCKDYRYPWKTHLQNKTRQYTARNSAKSRGRHENFYSFVLGT